MPTFVKFLKRGPKSPLYICIFNKGKEIAF